jgi:hypothetical protein
MDPGEAFEVFEHVPATASCPHFDGLDTVELLSAFIGIPFTRRSGDAQR